MNKDLQRSTDGKNVQTMTVRRISSFVLEGTTRYCLSFTMDRTVYNITSTFESDLDAQMHLSMIRPFDEIECFFRELESGEKEVVFICIVE